MALKVELKPGERIILGTSVVTNSNQRTRLFIEGDAPILREKDILTPKTADTPARRLYLTVQLIYLGGDIENLTKTYFEIVRDISRAAPSTLKYIDRINNEMLTGCYYKALKEAKALIGYEEDLLNHAKQSGSDLRTHGTGHHESARS